MNITKLLILKNISHIGDILAIPFFIITIIYFSKIKNRTFIENIILLFTCTALLFDIFFTFIYFKVIS